MKLKLVNLIQQVLLVNLYVYQEKNLIVLNLQLNLKALKKVLVGWEDINEEDGTPIEFSDKDLKRICRRYRFCCWCFRCF